MVKFKSHFLNLQLLAEFRVGPFEDGYIGIYFFIEVSHIFDKAKLLQLLDGKARPTPERPHAAEAA